MEVKKPIIWHITLSAIYTECPYCHAHNSENAYTGECKICHKIMNLSEEVVKKSQDVAICEKLDLSGPVYKDDKGQWKEWQDHYKVTKKGD